MPRRSTTGRRIACGTGGDALLHNRRFTDEGITLSDDPDAGATGTMTSALACEQIRPIGIDDLNGARTTAPTQYKRLLPLINLENRQCGCTPATR